MRGDDNIETLVGRKIVPAGPDECWSWMGAHSDAGYATHAAVGAVHRFVYATLVGSIRPGNVIHHECRNKGCVNPRHLRQMAAGDHAALHVAEHKFGRGAA